jgi:hypothetical protein
MFRLLRIGLFVVLLSLLPRLASAQITFGPAVPPTCFTGVGSLFFLTPQGPFHYCKADGTWSPLVAVPVPGAITLILSGVCPLGTSEVATMNGRMIIGTLAANGNVGTVGGTDTITPVGTVNLGSLAVTAHTSVATRQGTSAGNVVTTGTHVLTGTPAFIGTAFDNRSSFIRAIYCRAN